MTKHGFECAIELREDKLTNLTPEERADLTKSIEAVGENCAEAGYCVGKRIGFVAGAIVGTAVSTGVFVFVNYLQEKKNQKKD